MGTISACQKATYRELSTYSNQAGTTTGINPSSGRCIADYPGLLCLTPGDRQPFGCPLSLSGGRRVARIGTEVVCATVTIRN
jgi:hypothetical protein